MFNRKEAKGTFESLLYAPHNREEEKPVVEVERLMS